MFSHNIFLIGGKQIYDIAIKHPDLGLFYLTKIYNDFKCDVKFDYNLNNFENLFKSEKEFYKDHRNKDEFEVQFFTFRKIFSITLSS